MEIFLQNFFQYLTLMYLFVTAEAGVGLSFGSGRPPSPSNADSSNMIFQQLFDMVFSRECHAFSIF